MSQLPTALDRCRALRARLPGRVVLFALALSVFATQLLLQMHSARHDLVPSAHQVCEQCVTAEHAAPPPAAIGALLEPVLAGVSEARPVAQTGARAPLVVRNRAPPSRV